MKKKNRGFTLIESMIVVAMMGMVMGALYTAIIHFREVSGTEQSRVRQSQETRYMHTTFTTELQNAGSIASISNSEGMLGADSYFSGILPLNNNNWPDGVILASGDPAMVFKLTQPATGSSNTFQLTTTTPNPVWKQGDLAILLGEKSFCVYEIAQGTPTSVTTAGVAYFSGMLSTIHYQDPSSIVMGVNGRDATYPVKAPFIRLTNFAVYLIAEEFNPKFGRNTRNLYRFTNLKNHANPLAEVNWRQNYLVAENIYDLQLTYFVFPKWPDAEDMIAFFSSEITYKNKSTDFKDLMLQMTRKKFREIRLQLITTTDEYKGLGSVSYTIQPFADLFSAYTMPIGKYTLKQFQFVISPKNFGTVI